METILKNIQQGNIVRFTDYTDPSDPPTPEHSAYVMLAAERLSPETLDQLLALPDAVPLFSTTRDRLEQMGLFVNPPSDTPVNQDHAAESTAGSRPVPAQRLVEAAACLSACGADHSQADIADLDIRCIDWGGVVNCPRPYEAAVDLCRLAGLAPAAILCRFTLNATAVKMLEPWPGAAIAELVEHRKARARDRLPRSGPRTRMPTRYGNFNLQAYEDPLTGHLHIALWMGELKGPVLTRIHSECLTGDLFGSLRCDCGNQLDQALSSIAENGEGILLYLRQEGRGIGLVNKLRSYALQDQGLDTVEANERLGFGADLRDYSVAGLMLEDLGVTRVRLLTNNPRKIRGLERHGIQVDTRTPLIIAPCPDSEAYLHIKRQKLGHLLP